MRFIVFYLLLFLSNPSFSQVTLNLKLFIEGYYTGNGHMDNYGWGGCLFVNGISSNPYDADTVTVGLARTNDLSIAGIAQGILQTDGALSLFFTSINPGDAYFIRVSHRSALRTWSSVPVAMQAVTFYDFSDTISKAAGNNMMRSFDNQVWMFYSGDIADVNNTGLGLGFQDGIIEALDYLEMIDAVSLILQGYNCQDITGDGIVEATDFIIVERAVSAIVYEIPPSPVDISEIQKNQQSPTIFKCIILDGKILTDFRKLPDEDFSIYNFNGQKIKIITSIDLMNNEQLEISNGFYLLKVND